MRSLNWKERYVLSLIPIGNKDLTFIQFAEKSRLSHKYESRYNEMKKRLEDELKEKETIKDHAHNLKLELESLKFKYSEKGNTDYEGNWRC